MFAAYGADTIPVGGYPAGVPSYAQTWHCSQNLYPSSIRLLRNVRFLCNFIFVFVNLLADLFVELLR